VALFAFDDHEVRFCTQLKGKASWLLPFNQGYDDGAGNPPNPDNLKTENAGLLDALAGGWSSRRNRDFVFVLDADLRNIVIVATMSCTSSCYRNIGSTTARRLNRYRDRDATN